MTRSLSCLFLILVLCLTACTPSDAPPPPAAQLPTMTLDNTVKVVAGQTVYVPVYSQIYMWEQRRTINLTVTLSVRNTDLTHPMIIASVKYHGNNGNLLRNYLEKPVKLGPLTSTSFVVDQEDTTGGVETAFVVEWVSQEPVSVPVIESVMINTSGNQGISFVSPGRVIKSREIEEQENIP